MLRRLVRLERRLADQRAWLAAHGDALDAVELGRRLAIAAETEERWAAARIAFLEAAEICVTYYRAIDERPHRQVSETWSVDFRDPGKSEVAYRTQWHWWIQSFTEGGTK